jgi:hypothetical protein
MTVVKQLYHEKANLIWHFSAFEKSSATCYTAISFSLANFVAYMLLNSLFHLLSNMSRRLQAFCYQSYISFSSNALQQFYGASGKKWRLIIYDFTRQNRLNPPVNSLFLSPPFLLTVRGKK